MSGPISSINNCFLWYKADQSTGLSVSGSVIEYLADLSCSGNNLTPSASSACPTFIPNVINGYPVIRFNGSNDLGTNFNQSLNLTNNNLSLYSVFSVAITGQQAICALDRLNHESNVSFVQYLDTNNQLSWVDSANNYTFISGVTQNKFIIYTNRFPQSSNDVLLQYFNQSVESGNSNVAGISPNLKLGTSDYLSPASLQGDIAEIVAYNQPLSETDAALVYNYLYSKYFNASGTSPTSISANLFVDSSLNIQTSVIRPIVANLNSEANIVANASLITPTPTSTPSPIFLPNELSGLFAWYRSTSLGITGADGSPVQYWPDDSGSGNHLYVYPKVSGINTAFPSYYRNVFNIYPSVRFANNINSCYLNSSPANSSLQFSSDDLTTFSVFNTKDSIDAQTIYCLENVNSTNVAMTFGVCLNANGNSQFNLNYGNNNNLSFSTLTAINDHFTDGFYDLNTTVIRHDRFRKSDGAFLFGLYGADAASGLITIPTVNNASLSVGTSFNFTQPYFGDIAEIICYGRKLDENEVGQVSDYLLQKYLPGNVNICPLFTYSDSNSGIYNDIDLYLLSNNSGVTNNTTLYVSSSSLSISGTSLYSISIGSGTDSVPLYTICSGQLYPPMTLFLGCGFGSTGSIPLYTQAANFNQNFTTLYMSGSNTIGVGSIPLYTTNYNSSVSKNIPLYTICSGQIYPPITLYTVSIASGVNSPNHIYLYVSGTTVPSRNASTTLYLSNINSPGSSASGLYGNIPMFLEAGRNYVTLPLYIGVEPENTNPSGWMPLFVGTPYPTGEYTSNISLFLSNNVSGMNSIVKRLYIKGDGGLVGGSISTSPLLSLFIGTTGIPSVYPSGFSMATPLWIGPNTITSGNFSLFTQAVGLTNSGTPLYQYSYTSGYQPMELYMDGRNVALTNNVNLFTRGF